MGSEGHWWEKEPLRIFEACNPMNPLVNPANRDPVKEAELMAQVYANVNHFHVWGWAQPPGKGHDDTGFYFRTKVASRENVDYLARYLPEAHKRGVKVVVYFNVHWYDARFAEKHPEWAQITEKGKPLDGLYGSKAATSLCVNTPYREWCFQIVRDLCAYDIDGIFYDGPTFFEETCYCQSCREKYRRQHGKELPPKSNRQHPEFSQLMQFQTKSIGEFLQDTEKVIKSINPEILFYINNNPLGPTWVGPRVNRELIKHQDILGAEGGFIYGDLTRTPIWKPGSNTKLLETQAGGKPVVMFDQATHSPWGMRSYTLPDSEIRLLWAETVANGANAYLVIIGPPDPASVPKVIGQLHKFVRDNAQYYMKTKSEAKVALVWSEMTANHYEGSYAPMTDFTREYRGKDVGNVFTEFHGFYEALLRSHTPFDVIDDEYLQHEDLRRYRLIVLPNMACMSPRIARRLKGYVSDGGNLICTFETSLYDERGGKQEDFQLREIYGVCSKNIVFGPMNHDFLINVTSNPILEGVAEWIPAPKYGIEVKPIGATTLMLYSQRLLGVYDELQQPSEDAALTIHTHGAGRTAYFAGSIADSYATFHFNDYLRLIGNMVEEFAPPEVKLRNAPTSLEVTLRSQVEERRRIIHLVNFTGEMTRPIRQIIRLRNLKVTLKGVPRVKSVKTLMGHEELKFKSENATLAFTVPKIDEYEAVVIEGG